MGQCYCLEGTPEAPRDTMMISNIGGKATSDLQDEIGIDIANVPAHFTAVGGAAVSGAAVSGAAVGGAGAGASLAHSAISEEEKADSGVESGGETKPPPALPKLNAEMEVKKRQSPVTVGKVALVAGLRKGRKDSPVMKAGHVSRTKAEKAGTRVRPPAATHGAGSADAVRALQVLDKDGLIQLIVEAGVADALLERASELPARDEQSPLPESAPVEQQPAAVVPVPIENSPPPAAPVPASDAATNALREIAADLQAVEEAEQARSAVPKVLVALAVNKTASKLLARKAKAAPLQPQQEQQHEQQQGYKEPQQQPVEETALSLHLPPAAASSGIPDMAQPYELVEDQLRHRSSYRAEERPAGASDMAQRTRQRFSEYTRLAALSDERLRQEYAERGVPRGIGSYPSRHTVCLAIVKHIFQDAPPPLSREPHLEKQQQQTASFKSGRRHSPHRDAAPVEPLPYAAGLEASPHRRASALDASRISVSGSSVKRLEVSGFVSSAERASGSDSFSLSPGGGRAALHAHFGGER